jgi:trans-aconitate methyltransferase
MMFNAAYWDERFQKHGHTGHADPFLYSFDQTARHYAIESILQQIPSNINYPVLDFGCGSGDFLELLNRYYPEVVGYDISAKAIENLVQQYKQPSIKVSLNFNEVKAKAPYQLILSVTVLATLNNTELAIEVQQLAQTLNEGGYFLCLESFTNDERNQLLHEDKATESQWLKCISSNHLKVKQSYTFYNPVLYPSKSWLKYKYHPILNLLKPLRHKAWVKKIYLQKALQLIHQEKDVINIPSSHFKITLLQKQTLN